MQFDLKPTDDFLKDLKSIDKSVKVHLWKILTRIKQNPFLYKLLKHSQNCFSERFLNLRIVFKVQGTDIILFKVCSIKEAYKNL